MIYMSFVGCHTAEMFSLSAANININLRKHIISTNVYDGLIIRVDYNAESNSLFVNKNRTVYDRRFSPSPRFAKVLLI